MSTSTAEFGAHRFQNPAKFPINIDARALTQAGLIVNSLTDIFDTRQVQQVEAAPGVYRFQVYSALLSDVVFSVTSDGTVDYDPSLDGVLSGRGTSTLRVNGCHVVLDATALSQTRLALLLFNAPLFDTRAPVTMALLPAPGYTFLIGSAMLSNFGFDIDTAGTVHIDPNYRGIASGDGTPTLRVRGASVFITAEPTIDALALTNLLGGPVVLQTVRTNEVSLLPVAPGAAYSMTAVSTKTSMFNFNLDLSGNFSFDPSLDGYLQGRGTPSLNVYSDSTASLDHWIPVGPAPEDLSQLGDANVSGRVWAIAFSADFDGHGTPAMFIGTGGGGVWRSTDFTSASPTWSPLTDHVPSLFPMDRQIGLLNIGALAVDPNHPRTIYAGSGTFDDYGHGILQSTDGGDTWRLLTVGGATIPGFSRIFVDPTDRSGNTVYAVGGPGITSPLTPPTVTLHGIYKTVDAVDGGANWALAQGNMPAGVEITDLDFIVNNGQPTLFVGVNDTTGSGSGHNGIWQSTDGGRSWDRMLVRPLTDLQTGQRVPETAIGMIKLAADHIPGAPHGVFAAISNATSSTLLNVFNLAGRIWEPCGLGIQGNISTYAALAMGLSESGAVYVGMGADSTATDGIYQSPDGGSTWASILMGTNGVRPHHDQRCWGFGAGLVFEGNDGGIYRFNPRPNRQAGPGVWQSLNTPGLQTILSNGLGLHPQYPNVMLEGSQDNAIALRTHGTWKFVTGGDAGPVLFDSSGQFAWQTGLPQDGSFLGFSQDGGATWSDNSPRNVAIQPGYAPIATHPTEAGRVLVGQDRVLEWRQAIGAWRAISGALAGASIFVSTLAYAGGDVIYVAFGSRLFKTTNDGGDSSDANWAELNAGNDWHGTIITLSVDPNDTSKSYMAADGGAIWRSPDGGKTWAEITGDFPRALGANSLALRSDRAGSEATLFAGTKVGVYTSFYQGGLTSWKRMGSDLPDVSVTGLEFHRTTKYLVASTYGRGLFAAYLHFTTDVAPAGATVANVVFNFAKDLDGGICVNQAEFGRAFSGWFEVPGDLRTDAAPAAAAVGNHLFVVVKGLDGHLYLNQADLGHPFNNFWTLIADPIQTDECRHLAEELATLERRDCSHIPDPDAQAECIRRKQEAITAKIEEQTRAGCLDPLRTDVAPTVAGVGNNVYFFAKSLDGRIFKNQAALGQGGQGWVEVEGSGRTDAAPAAAAIGNHVFVAVKALGRNEILLNQADLGQPFGQWFPMGFSTDVAPAVATVGNNVYFFAKSLDGRIFKNQAVLGQGGQGWVEVEGGGHTDAAPAAVGVGNSILCFVKRLDGRIYLNRAEVDHPFSGWFEVGGGIYELTAECRRLAEELAALERRDCSHIPDPEAQAECIRRKQEAIRAKVEQQRRAGCLDPLQTMLPPQRSVVIGTRMTDKQARHSK